MGQIVLVTGVARYLGGHLARLLAASSGVERVIGVDVVAPSFDLGDAEFVRADIRNPIISKVVSAGSVDTVVHMGVLATPKQAGSRALMKEINVIGSMQLLAACQRSDSVKRLVVKSTTSVYGAGPRDPAMFTEDMAPKSVPTGGWAKDSIDVETYVRGFARRRPDVVVTNLRFANVLGPGVRTAMTGYLTMPIVPTVLGYDARMQFIHEDDLIAATMKATLDDFSGTYNVAADGTMMLSQILRRSGDAQLPLARQIFRSVAKRLPGGARADFSDGQVRFLTYGRGVDTTKMRTKLGFVPARTTEQTLDDYLRSIRNEEVIHA